MVTFLFYICLFVILVGANQMHKKIKELNEVNRLLRSAQDRIKRWPEK